MDEIAEIPQIQSFAFLKKVGIYLVLQKHLELFKKLKSLNSSKGMLLVKEGLKNVHGFGQSFFSVSTKFLKFFSEKFGDLEF